MREAIHIDVISPSRQGFGELTAGRSSFDLLLLPLG